VLTRRFSRTREPVGRSVVEVERSTSKSAVSREFVGRTREHLVALMSRRLDDVRLSALMLDGIDLKGRCCVVALGITTQRVKIPLGLSDGSTENRTVARHLLADLVDRGLDVEQGVLVVLDGGKALRAAAREVLGPVPVWRCIRQKERNVLDHLPERHRPQVKCRLQAAWKLTDHASALDRLGALAGELERSHPGAAGSLREGLEETLTPSAPGDRRAALAHPGEHESHRVDDRDRQAHQPATSSAGRTARCACAGPRPACSKPNVSFARSSATSTWPGLPSPSRPTSPPP
jgi:putative transposase